MAFSRQHIVSTVPRYVNRQTGRACLSREGNRARVLPDTYLTPRLGSLKVGEGRDRGAPRASSTISTENWHARNSVKCNTDDGDETFAAQRGELLRYYERMRRPAAASNRQCLSLISTVHSERLAKRLLISEL